MRSLLAVVVLCAAATACSSSDGDGGCVDNLECETNPSFPCRSGVIACLPTVSCVDDANTSPGFTCGTNQVCNGSGQCVACTAGTACTDNPSGICHLGITTCAGGSQFCIDYGHADAGVVCGTNQICNGIGECVSCPNGCDAGF